MVKRNVIIALTVVIALTVTLLILILTGNCCFKDRCEIAFGNDVNTPLFLEQNINQFIYPENEGSLLISRDKSIILGCPGSELNNGNVYTKVTCITETNFVSSGDNVDISDLYCEDQIKSTARYTGNTCGFSGKEIEVGYNLGEEKFVRQLRICFDEREQNTLYSEHNLTSEIYYRQFTKKKPFFIEGNIFYKLNGTALYTLYNKEKQRATINKQLGFPANSTNITNNFFLTRGHLAPNGDFFYLPQQNASYYYINTAPQWGSINSGSWNYLEWKIRLFSSKKSRDFQIFTGTYGHLTIQNSSDLYLYYEENKSNQTNKAIPIPKVFWKVVYDSKNKQGVAFVGTNDPFLKGKPEFYCPDVSRSIDWISLNSKNATNGVIYACNVDDLRKNITFIPKLEIHNLLT